MYKDNRGLKEWHIDNTFPPAFVKKCKIFDIDPSSVRFYSQQDEDKYIIQHILKDKIDDGVFLELGACDGILYSNTKMLEDNFGFNGILIEPLYDFFNNLVVNRPNCELYNCAVSNDEEEYVDFSGNNAEAGITHHLKDSNQFQIKVKNMKMKDLFKRSKFDYIDILILDVEGAEFEVLKSIDFTEMDIYCIFTEAHSDQQERNKVTGDFLKSKGFVYKDRQRGNEVWINLNSKRSNLFQGTKKEETV